MPQSKPTIDAPNNNTGTSPPGALRVLVVDAKQASRELTVQLLLDCQYQVLEDRSGEDRQTWRS